MSADETRIFIDSNIWLYALIHGQDSAKSALARELLTSADRSIFISTQVVTEVSVNLIRKTKADEPFIRELTSSFYNRYTVSQLTKQTLLLASEVRGKHSLSFWDSLIISSALEAGASVLYSEDMQDRLIINDVLTITNPFIKNPAL